MAVRPKSQPKQVVYLWGAGATHSEALVLGTSVNLLMRDDDVRPGVTRRILRRLGPRFISSYDGIGQGVDIEKLISLLATSGIQEHTEDAERMRRAYFKELCVSLDEAGVIAKPSLTTKLLRLHDDRKFREEVEELTGIITTNHDGLLQVASQEVFRRVNIGFDFVSSAYSCDLSHLTPPIYQLHGSFTWKWGNPIKVTTLRKTSKYDGSVWIPPTILKESKNYPFNKLMGFAYEILAKKCDVLRVVGASLTQNDWNILSLIFNAQRHREVTRGTVFRIELILPHKHGETIQRDCAYLRNVFPIGFLSEGDFEAYKQDEVPADSDMTNPFAYWLDQKIEYHQALGELSATENTRPATQPAVST